MSDQYALARLCAAGARVRGAQASADGGIEPKGASPACGRGFRDLQHLAAKVRALSYRIPLFVRVGNQGFTYSISGWARF